MHRLPLSFALLTICGYWRPVKWPIGSLKYRLYNIYSAFMILLMYFFTFCTCVDSVISKDFKTMTEKFSLVISVIGVSLKVTNLFVQRKKIISVMDILLRDNCLPGDDQEKIIQRRNDNYARNLTVYCEILNESAVFFGTVAQFKNFLDSRTLPVSDWVPYDLASRRIFTITLIQQTIGLMICANTSVANETLIAGLMIQAGSQFEIFCHRARNLSSLLMEARNGGHFTEEIRQRCKKILGNFVEYHLEIYEFARTINTVFEYVIFLQFAISSTVLCLTIWKMSSIDSANLNFIWSFFYLCCMLMQVYLYCWFGNELTLKSNEVCNAIYEMDWTILPVDLMRDLLLIMERSKRPVKMTSGNFLVLSAESFMTIMKLTYSSFNLLSNTTNK